MTVRQAGAIDQTVYVRAFTTTGGTAAPAYNDAGISLWYKRGAAGAVTAITPASQTSEGVHTDGGFVHLGNGWARLDLPDAAGAAGVASVLVGGGASGWVLISAEVLLLQTDPTIGQTGDAFARMGEPAGDSIAADIAGVQADTNDIQARIPAALTGDGNMKADALKIEGADPTDTIDARLAAYDPPTKAEMDAGLAPLADVPAIKAKTDALPSDPADQSAVEAAITSAQAALASAISALNNLSQAQAQAAAAAALAAYDPPTKAELDAGLAPLAVEDGGRLEDVDDLLGELTEDVGGARFTEHALEEAPGSELVTDLAALIEDIQEAIEDRTVYATGSAPDGTAALTIRRGDTVPVEVGDLASLADGWESLWLTIKRSEHERDDQALLQVRLDAGDEPGPGLVCLGGQTPEDAGVTAADAWLSEVDPDEGTLKLNLLPAASSLLPAKVDLWWDVQMLKDGDVTTLATGQRTARILADVTRAIE